MNTAWLEVKSEANIFMVKILPPKPERKGVGDYILGEIFLHTILSSMHTSVVQSSYGKQSFHACLGCAWDFPSS